MSGNAKSYGGMFASFQEGLKELGYVEGKNIILDVRTADDRLDRLPELAAELLAAKPDVLFTSGSPGVFAAHRATSTIPIVFASLGDPIGQGIIKSYANPGGNLTGISWNEEINKKQYELVKDLMPSVSRIATLVNIKNQAQKHHLEDVATVQKLLNFEHLQAHATNEEELEPAFRFAVEHKAQAIVATGIAPFTSLRHRIVELQFRYRLPAFFASTEAVRVGALASYSFPPNESWRRAATFVDKILKGAKPANLPVEIPHKYEIAVNLKTAIQLNLNVPNEFVVRANLIVK